MSIWDKVLVRIIQEHCPSVIGTLSVCYKNAVPDWQESSYYREEMNTDGDTEPIGIVLGAYQDKLVMQYALQNITNQVFVSRYQLYLPEREQLEAEFRRFMDGADAKRDDNSKSSDTV